METFIISIKFLAKISLLSGVVLSINHGLNFIHDFQIQFKSKQSDKRRERKAYEIDDLREKFASRN